LYSMVHRFFTGAAGSGESNIRRWIIENDWLEAIVAMPDQLFYNTGISTYIWIVTNRKEKHRRGKIQLIDATLFCKMRRASATNAMRSVTAAAIMESPIILPRLPGYMAIFKEGTFVRIFDNSDFGYHRITVERPLRLNFAVTEERLTRITEARQFVTLATSRKRKDTKAAETEVTEGKQKQATILEALKGLEPLGVVNNRDVFSTRMKAIFKEEKIVLPAPLFKAILMALSERDETADICTDSKGNPEPDPELRDYENVPLKEDIHKYMDREVLPHVPDAWVDESKTKIGYEINFNRYFYKYTPPRPLEEIETDLRLIEKEIADMLAEVAG